MNDARVHHNWIFDNWRNGAMLFAVPDAFTNGGGAEGDIFPGVSCPGAPQNGFSTSCGNRFYDNHVGRAPTGFTVPRTRSACSATRTRRDDGAAGEAERQRLLVGRVLPDATRQLLVRNTGCGRHGGERDGPGPGRAGSRPRRRRCCRRTARRAWATTTRPSSNYLVECSNGPDDGHRAGRLRLVDRARPPGSRAPRGNGSARQRRRAS